MPTSLNALQPGYRLGGHRIKRYLGLGGFSITHSGIAENLDQRVAIKEYIPSGLTVRDANDRVMVTKAEDEAEFCSGLDRLLDEARSLAGFDYPRTMRINRPLEAFGTGYIVIEQTVGEPPWDFFYRKPTLTEAEKRVRAAQLSESLSRVRLLARWSSRFARRPT